MGLQNWKGESLACDVCGTLMGKRCTMLTCNNLSCDSDFDACLDCSKRPMAVKKAQAQKDPNPNPNPNPYLYLHRGPRDRVVDIIFITRRDVRSSSVTYLTYVSVLSRSREILGFPTLRCSCHGSALARGRSACC